MMTTLSHSVVSLQFLGGHGVGHSTYEIKGLSVVIIVSRSCVYVINSALGRLVQTSRNAMSINSAVFINSTAPISRSTRVYN